MALIIAMFAWMGPARVIRAQVLTLRERSFIEIARLSGDAARESPYRFIELMAMVSLNLAIFNLLPIPILDGGVILMLLVEMTMRRDLSLPVKEAVIKVGFVFLMMVVAFVLYNDITKVLPSSG